MALEGTFTTPVGPIQKKTGLIVLGLAVAIMGYSYYRAKKQSAVAASGANTGIDPATGFAYGSAEDAAALAAQTSYVTPTAGSGSGSASGGYPPVGTGFVNNAAWTQAVLQYGQSQGLLVDSTPMSTALGRYIAGEPVGADQQALIDQAVAWEGYPPISGPTGYPPHVNTTPATTPPDGGGGGGTPPPAGPLYATVLGGWHVDQWIDDVNRGYAASAPSVRNLTWDNLVKWNDPGLEANIKWQKGNATYPGSRNNIFKATATYRVQ